ncbi:hypothetical protein EJ357_35315 [Streptomyces cyaneochromogenes]|uniref:Uncharacterized protein n=1 Tax=Streptomyces cyaneochromogenes TaxID=2496836 RepID=A0A3Q9EX71_9ACTN|nr:hypothetical protein [Streptomyces cyaneochromogenes]AZQ38078.1 hypothetical protein EJ357_35315 [Streptomyces cyaneochromogenes]
MSDLYDPNKRESDGPSPDPTSTSSGSGLPPGAPPPTPPVNGAGDAPDPGPVPGFGLVPDAVSSREPTRISPVGPDEDRIRVGLWGAPRSGKTTYLTALPIAAMQYQRHNEGSWHITGMTPEANDFLARGVDLLTRERAFPPASMGVQGMAWSVQGPEKREKLRTRRPDFVLEIQDAAGEVFLHNHPQQAQLVAHLARSQGLIYLFDPIGDAEEATGSFTYLQATLTQLTAMVRDRGELVKGRLPHHVSVCIAKFDHPDVFRPAVEAGWVVQDTVGSQLPRVPRDRSEKYFQWMCEEFRGSNARLVRDALYSHFDPDRISYYATSSVGFRLNPQHVFDLEDYVQPVAVDGTPRIRTSPVPINALEPLIDLESRIHQDRGRGRGGWLGGKRR